MKQFNGMRQLGLAVLIAVFVCLLSLGGCTTRPENAAGMINDQIITEQSYNSLVRRQYESFRLEHNRKPNDEEWDKIHQDTWNSIIHSTILQTAYREYRISVTQQEVLDSLLASPPGMILNSPRFTENRKFDQQKFEASLISGEPVDLNWLKERYLFVELPYRKLRRAVLDDIPVTEEELRQQYHLENATADVSLIKFDPATFEGYVSPYLISDYYNEYRKRFFVPANCNLSYIIYPLVPSQADSARAAHQADSLYIELKNGADFAVFALEHSRDESRTGNIGFVSVSSLDTLMIRQLRSETGITHPFRYDDGWRILKAERWTQNMVQLRELFIPIQYSEATRDSARQFMINIRDLATQSSLIKAAPEFGLESHTIFNLNLDNTEIPGLGESFRTVERALNSEPGTIFHPQFHPGINSWVLVQVLDANPGFYKPLVEVTDEIRDSLHRQEQIREAIAEANRYRAEYGPEGIIAHAKFENVQTEAINRLSFKTPLSGRRHPDINHEILFAEAPAVLGPYTLEQNVVVILVSTVHPPPVPFKPGNDEHLAAGVRARKRADYFQQWLQDRLNNAEVHDWRNIQRPNS